MNHKSSRPLLINGFNGDDWCHFSFLIKISRHICTTIYLCTPQQKMDDLGAPGVTQLESCSSQLTVIKRSRADWMCCFVDKPGEKPASRYLLNWYKLMRRWEPSARPSCEGQPGAHQQIHLCKGQRLFRGISSWLCLSWSSLSYLISLFYYYYAFFFSSGPILLSLTNNFVYSRFIFFEK